MFTLRELALIKQRWSNNFGFQTLHAKQYQSGFHGQYCWYILA